MEVEGTRQGGRPRKTWKEVVDKDMDDLLIKQSDAVDRGKWRKMIRGIGTTVAVTVMPIANYKLYNFGASSPMLTWI